MLLYPIISFLINRFIMGEDGSPLSQIASEAYLWFGYSITYIAIIALVFFGTKIILNTLLAFIVYSIGYFVISILRKTIFTDTTSEY